MFSSNFFGRTSPICCSRGSPGGWIRFYKSYSYRSCVSSLMRMHKLIYNPLRCMPSSISGICIGHVDPIRSKESITRLQKNHTRARVESINISIENIIIHPVSRKEFGQLTVTLYTLSIYLSVHNQLCELFSRDGLLVNMQKRSYSV